MKALRIVFLDIDGVLLTGRYSFRAGQPGGAKRPADPEAVSALNQILSQTGAVIVVSSTWRLDYTLAEMTDALRRWGVAGLVLDQTPEAAGAVRGEEIRAWLAHTAETGRFVIDSYVILVDEDEDGSSDRLVQTRFEEGLTMDHAQRAIELLTGGRCDCHDKC